MEKAVQNVIETQIKRSDPETFNEEDAAGNDSMMWSNPLMAQMAPMIYKFGISLPMFYVEAQSLMQLIQEKPEFKQPFLWIP